MGTNGMVTSSHYLATVEGLQVLRKGGNVVDAGATMWFMLTLLKPHLIGVAGESPILLYVAEEEKVISVNGQGPAPMAATIQWFEEQGYPLIPEDGFTPAVVPAAFDAWITVLEKFGSFSLGQVMEPAIKLAKNGFPVFPTLANFFERVKKRYLTEWPSTAKIYLPDRMTPKVGQVINNPDWSRTFTKVAEVEAQAGKAGRSAGFDAAQKYFYDGPITEKIIDFMQTFECTDVYGKTNPGLIAHEDFATFKTKLETPETVNYRGLDVYKCGPWCQGPVLLQQLTLLEGFNLTEMGHNSIEYLHTLIECAKLAFADREQYYADPEFVDVPLERLLSKEYAKERRTLIDPENASMLHRPGGVPPSKLEEKRHTSFFEGDTVHLEAVDHMGNMLSATPSGGWIRTSPIVPGLGFCMGTRAQMMYLDPNHAECLEPGKRPSTTLTPSLVMQDKAPYMVFGTPGGDRQDQWTLQFFLNYVEFDMNVQEALDAPTVHINHFPASFWPHSVKPGEVCLEPRIPKGVVDSLTKKGHKIIHSQPWSHGRCQAIRYDPETGVMYGGASPRTGEPYAIGW